MNRVRGDVRVLEDAAAVARALADHVAACAREAIALRGRFDVALAGGTTPRAAYALLAESPRAQAVAWGDVHVYFGDERCVPPDHDASNYRMAHDALLSRVAIAPGNVHRMCGELDPPTAAREYARMLVTHLGMPPRFDLVMLGLGVDAHTASLFPGSDPLTDASAFVRAVRAPGMAVEARITITPPLINAARNVVFAVEGATKAQALATVLHGPYDPQRSPAQIVAPIDGNLLWLVDLAAASKL